MPQVGARNTFMYYSVLQNLQRTSVSARTLRLADMVGQDNLPTIQEQKKRAKAEAASVGARL